VPRATDTHSSTDTIHSSIVCALEGCNIYHKSPRVDIFWRYRRILIAFPRQKWLSERASIRSLPVLFICEAVCCQRKPFPAPPLNVMNKNQLLTGKLWTKTHGPQLRHSGTASVSVVVITVSRWNVVKQCLCSYLREVCVSWPWVLIHVSRAGSMVERVGVYVKEDVLFIILELLQWQMPMNKMHGWLTSH
jgi:hypothetical protein